MTSLHRSRFALAIVAFAILLALVTLAPTPASAHDRLVASTPASGDVLDAPPTEITLTFSADVLDTGLEVLLTDADGAVVPTGTPTVDGTVVTVPVEGAVAAGDHRLDWRVVSSDGHPIADALTFSVTTGTAPTTTAPAETLTATPEPAPTTIAEPAPESASPVAQVLVGVAGLLVVVGVAWAVIARRRRTRARDGESPRE